MAQVAVKQTLHIHTYIHTHTHSESSQASKTEHFCYYL